MDTRKEKEGEAMYDPVGTVNIFLMAPYDRREMDMFVAENGPDMPKERSDQYELATRVE